MAGPGRALAVVALVVVIPLRSAAQSTNETDALMNRVTAWVHQWVSAYTNVVAEEAYVQETTSPRRRRTLRSDYMLVRFPGAQEWHTFRDVIEVDGKPVGEQGRTERMMKTELRPGRFSPPTTRLVTTFRFDTQLGIDVPAKMEDLYRFQATAREEIAVPPNPR